MSSPGISLQIRYAELDTTINNSESDVYLVESN